jgi:hypothetical protein
MNKLQELIEQADELINFGDSKEQAKGYGMLQVIKALNPSISKMANALQNLNNTYGNNWDIIIDTVGEDIANDLDIATVVSRELI